MDEQPAAEAGREGVDRAIAERVKRVMWTSNTKYEPQGIAKRNCKPRCYLRQRIGWSSFEKLILVKLMLCFLFTLRNEHLLYYIDDIRIAFH